MRCCCITSIGRYASRELSSCHLLCVQTSFNIDIFINQPGLFFFFSLLFFSFIILSLQYHLQSPHAKALCIPCLLPCNRQPAQLIPTTLALSADVSSVPRFRLSKHVKHVKFLSFDTPLDLPKPPLCHPSWLHKTVVPTETPISIRTRCRTTTAAPSQAFPLLSTRAQPTNPPTPFILANISNTTSPLF